METDSLTAAQPVELHCEYFENPLGIDATSPRFSWKMRDNRRGARQTAYHLIAADSAAGLDDDNPKLWDTGKVKSSQSLHISWEGPALKSGQRVYWKVQLSDTEGNPTAWSQPAWFEMGLLESSDWLGKWIGSSVLGGPRTVPPAPFLRKEFSLPKPVRTARLYATALGLYEFHLNGSRVGDFVFSPGRTEYKKRVQYNVFDVTDQLRQGDNAMGAILGDGWYSGHVHVDPRQYYGDRPRLLAQLRVDYTDGSSQTFSTDESWKTAVGPILANDILQGEAYDARLEMPGWNEPRFNDAEWLPVKTFADPGITINALRCPPVRRIQEISPKGVAVKLKRAWIFDMGQNMVGRVRLKFTGKRGQTLTVRHAEMLDNQGRLYTEALRSARATDYYTLKGEGEETFEPRFTFHGFRYVEVTGLPINDGPPSNSIVTGVVLHTDIPFTGEFHCSDAMLNQLQHNITWSQRGNFLEIPTDCPQRDERLGWTGDAQVFIRTAAFNMDVAGFFTKWLLDVEDAQGADGRIPSVVPDCPSIPGEGGPAWADAAVICPWTVYLCYGDKRILETCYPTMTKFLDFLIANSKNYIRADENWKWKGYGDWLSINAETPKELIGTAFYAHCARLMSRIATIIGKPQDAEKYQQLFETVRKVWLNRYVTPGGLIIGQTQTAYVLALQFDLLPPEQRPAILQALVRDIEARNMHLSTGFVGTPYLTHVLTDWDRLDVAYALLHQTTYPSWLYPVTQGATTMWERWDAWTHDKGFNDAGMNSYNHYAYGAVGEWMYAVVAGIDLDPEKPGYKHIIIRPHPGGKITSARAKLNSPYGEIESDWKLQDGIFDLKVTIPANTTATLRIPTANTGEVTESGQPTTNGAIPGLRFISSEGQTAVFEAAPGTYNLRAPAAKA